MKKTVVGLDLSLTSTGVAVLGAPGSVARVKSKPTTSALRDRQTRFYLLLGGILEVLPEGKELEEALIVVEGPSYGSTSGSHHDRSGLWWFLVSHFLNGGSEVVEVPPTCVKKYATGKGNAQKDEVLAQVIRRYTGVNVGGNDEADALVLAAMGSRAQGYPIDHSLPKVNLTAMDKVAWPSFVDPLVPTSLF